MASFLRRALLVVGLFALVVYGWLAFRHYRGSSDPEAFRAWDRPAGWMIEPPAPALKRAAQQQVDAGLRILNDRSVPSAERIEAYRARLRAARELLVRSLRVQPAQAPALAQLAAIDWELDPPLTEEEVARHLRLVALASRMAPRAPRVHSDLGKLLLRMGRRQEAVGYLRRAVELDPSAAITVVAVLTESSFSARQVAEALPVVSDVLVALQGPFLEEDLGEPYVALLEHEFDAAGESAPMLRAMANACLRIGDPGRLLEFLRRLGPPGDERLRVERLVQASRASLLLGRERDALDEALRARDAFPDDPRLNEHLGDVAVSAGEPEDALAAFRRALAALARASAIPAKRARLYRKIGQCQEAIDHAPMAYDAYKRALDLDPGEVFAGRRVREMEESAGVRSR